MCKIDGEAADGSSDSESPSCLELAGDRAGCFDSGRSDAATDPRLLEEAILLDARASASAVKPAGDD